MPDRELSPFRFCCFATIDSTNLEARRDAERGAAEFNVYVAEMQTAGRGREGRSWHSPAEGGIYCSVLFRPALTPSEALIFTRFSALSIHEVLGACLAGHPEARLRIKPPNDLQISGRKVCGILVESASMKSATQFVVVGFGINVNQTGFPPELDGLATSLRLECGRRFDRAELLARVLTHLLGWYGLVQREGVEEVHSAWKRLTGESA